MKNNLSEVLQNEQTAVKVAFLSYYISMYTSVNKEIGYEDAPISVEEIYNFVQDLKHEVGKQVPDIKRADVSLCFHLLETLGVCRI